MREDKDPIPFDGIEYLENIDGNWLVHSNDENKVNALIKLLIDHGIHLISFSEIIPSLDEIFIQTVVREKQTA